MVGGFRWVHTSISGYKQLSEVKNMRQKPLRLAAFALRFALRFAWRGENDWLSHAMPRRSVTELLPIQCSC